MAAHPCSRRERTAFVRFRRLPVVHQLDRLLLETVTMQFKSKTVTVKTGAKRHKPMDVSKHYAHPRIGLLELLANFFVASMTSEPAGEIVRPA